MQLEYSKKELEQIAKLYGVKGAYKLKKAELVEILQKAIPEGMGDILPMLDVEDIGRFESLLEQGEISLEENQVVAYYNLMELELVQYTQTEKEHILRVDNMIKDAYKQIDMNPVMEQIKANSELRNFVISILNLYGVVKLDWAVELYNRDHQEQTDIMALNAFVKKDMRLACQCKVMEGYIVEETVYALDKNNFNDFLKATVERDYFIPSKELLTKMQDERYYENTLAVQKLKAHLKNVFKLDEKTLEEAIVAITMISRVDCDRTGKTMELMLEELANLGVEFKDLTQINDVIKHIIAVVNTTRKWVNKGFTAQELSPHTFNEKTGQKVKVLDVGRNEPCPCGSGKKYKKCCGN